MSITILTLFPDIFSPLHESILKRAQEKGLVKINIVNIRDFATDKHRTVDDRPYGGGPGMILKIDVLTKAIESIKSKIKNQKSKINFRLVLTSATGKPWKQAMARQYSKCENIIIVCGHYEGVDARITEVFPEMEEISIGKYVLTGGELPAMVMVDSIVRLIPGVLKKPEAVLLEPYSNKITNSKLQFPNKFQCSKSKIQKAVAASPRPPNNIIMKQFTRPFAFRGFQVPEVLLSGDPRKIKEEGF